MIRWKNLLSTGNVFTEVNLAAKGTTLIVGDNGSGKSSLLDAFSYVLYGKPFRKINKPQMLNSINKKDLLVEIEFSIGDSQFSVRRGMKPNVFEVWQNGRMLDQHGAMADLQEYLERHVLKMNHRSCMQVVVLGSASFVPFMELPAAHRREVLEDILDIQVLSTMNVLLKGKADETTRNLRDADAKRDPMADMVSMQESFDKVIEDDRKERVAAYEKKIADLEVKKAEQAEKAVAILEEMTALKAILTNQPAELREEALRQLSGVRALKSQAVDRRSFFEKNKKCPSCEQDIGPDHQHSSISSLDAEIERLGTIGDELVVAIDKWKVEVDANSKNAHRVQELNSDLAMIKRIVTGIDADIASANKDIAQANRTVKKTNTDLATLRTELELLDKNRGEMMQAKEIQALVGGLLKDSGVKATIVKQYIPIINKLINKYLAALDFFTNFELDEEFNEKILSRHRDDFSYNSFSEGEKTRINLAILFTWRAIAKMRNSAATNLVIMDEIFDSSLDTTGAEDFTKLLTKLTEDTHAIIISHRNDQISDKFDRVVKFEKHKNFSRIVV